jgi:hypothetical protein
MGRGKTPFDLSWGVLLSGFLLFQLRKYIRKLLSTFFLTLDTFTIFCFFTLANYLSTFD